ncbi:MAG: metal-dependent transcriptional regulator [Candidatus Thermoplasmatota archaeon]|nr:metal-dependent transcriptional regulator [Candidatus Thermoplasmatota archaeon]
MTEMLRKLQEDGYVEYEPWKGTKLTPSGKKVALRLMKTHKTIADFLEIIGIERELAEIDTCQIEHYVSPQTMARLTKSVRFVSLAPQEPKWIKHFNQYVRTGERPDCEFQVATKGSPEEGCSRHRSDGA